MLRDWYLQVIRTNFRPFAKRKFPQFFGVNYDTDNFVDTLYDLLIIPAVYYYHKSGTKKIFSNYLSDFLEHKVTNINAYKIVEKYAQALELKLHEWKKTKSFTHIKELGDFHECVCKIKSNEKVYYENVLQIEHFLEDIKQLLPWTKKFLPKSNFERGYVSRAFLENQQNNVNLDDYYMSAGKMIAFCMYFRIIDVHMENLITYASNPVLIDLEFILTPETSYFPFDIKVTGLVAGQSQDNNSALLGGLYSIKSYLKPIIILEKNTCPQIKWIVDSKGKWDNLPSKEVHPYKYVDQIMKGYKEATEDLIKKTDTIKDLLRISSFKTRVLTRTTRTYRFLTLSYCYPQVMIRKPQVYFSKQLRALHTSEFYKPMLKELINYESEQLSSNLIPYFTQDINQKYVHSSDGRIVGRTVDTPLENWVFYVKTFKNFSESQGRKLERILHDNYLKHFNRFGV